MVPPKTLLGPQLAAHEGGGGAETTAEYGALILGTQHPAGLSPRRQHRRDNVDAQRVEKHKAARGALLP